MKTKRATCSPEQLTDRGDQNSAILKGMVPRQLQQVQVLYYLQKLYMHHCHVLPTFYWGDTMVA